MIVVVAISDGAAHDQQQDLAERVEDAAHIPRVLDLRKVVEQNGQARLV
jgi:hypothetical protein